MKKSRLLSIILTLSMAVMLFAGCSPKPQENVTLATGGTLLLKVNPEIAVSYDENGLVTALTSRNQDAQAILEGYTGFEGKEATIVIKELVEKIGNAGYFVEEVEGERRHIVIEIEKGSVVPNERFIDNIVVAVKEIVNNQKWYSPLDVVNGQGYGYTDYVDTDYGAGNDGITDYIDTDYGEYSDGVTDFYDTDYGYKNDGVTDFDYTDYGTADYGPKPTAAPAPQQANQQSGANSQPKPKPHTDYDVTDYGVTDYGPKPTARPAQQTVPQQKPHTDYGNTDYNRTDYGTSNYDGTDYD